jgi:hypothetical protein
MDMGDVTRTGTLTGPRAVKGSHLDGSRSTRAERLSAALIAGGAASHRLPPSRLYVPQREGACSNPQALSTHREAQLQGPLAVAPSIEVAQKHDVRADLSSGRTRHGRSECRMRLRAPGLPISCAPVSRFRWGPAGLVINRTASSAPMRPTRPEPSIAPTTPEEKFGRWDETAVAIPPGAQHPLFQADTLIG